MNLKQRLTAALAAALLLTTTGCFRVSSDTRALRDAALEFTDADEQIELGVGILTMQLARFGSRFLDLPPEAKMVLEAVGGAECSVYELRGGKANFAEVLAQADKAMEKRGCDRIVGVIDRDQLVAVYLAPAAKSHRNTTVNVLVLNKEQLVCVKARGDIEPLVEMVLDQARQRLPVKARLASSL